jgi:methionine sulfoxide reductase heme-binding subunit
MTALESSKAVWYLMRATGVVSLVLLTIVFALGIATINRWRVGRAPAFVTASVHRSISLLSVVFIGVHVATAVADPYAAVNVVAVVIPFSGSTAPLWLGLGALSLDLIAALILSSLLRRRIGVRAWRTIHWLAYLSWPVALAHTLGEGTDVKSLWLRAVTGFCTATIVAAIVWRLGARRPGKHLEPARSRRLASPARAEAAA